MQFYVILISKIKWRLLLLINLHHYIEEHCFRYSGILPYDQHVKMLTTPLLGPLSKIPHILLFENPVNPTNPLSRLMTTFWSAQSLLSLQNYPVNTTSLTDWWGSWMKTDTVWQITALTDISQEAISCWGAERHHDCFFALHVLHYSFVQLQWIAVVRLKNEIIIKRLIYKGIHVQYMFKGCCFTM